MLKYCLIENPMPKGEQDYIASVACNKIIKMDHYIDDMVAEGTGLTRPQAIAYFEKLIQLTERYLKKGNFISTPLFRYRTSISGTFTSKGDKFDPDRHLIKISSTPGSRIRNIKMVAELKKESVIPYSPEIYQVIDSITDEINSCVSSGNLATIQGRQLKFDKHNQNQGIFFISDINPKLETRASVYSGIKPSEVHFVVPILAKGTYKLVFKSNAPVSGKKVTALLDEHITVY